MSKKKAVPFILPLAVWISITAYMAAVQYVLSPLIDLSFSPQIILSEETAVWIEILIHSALQILIVSVLTVIAARKFDYGAKGLVISLPIMLVLFAVYRVPTLYLFVYTGEWSFMFTDHPAMNRFLAAFLITLQYGIVMSICVLTVYAHTPLKIERNSADE